MGLTIIVSHHSGGTNAIVSWQEIIVSHASPTKYYHFAYEIQPKTVYRQAITVSHASPTKFLGFCRACWYGIAARQVLGHFGASQQC